MEKERIVFQTKRSFGIIIFGILLGSFLFTPIILESLQDKNIRGAVGTTLILMIFIWVATTQEKQITLYESYLRIDSKANILFKPKEFKYTDIKQIIVSYKSWRPTFIGGITVTYKKDGKVHEKGFVVDVKNRNIEYPELLKHLKELVVYAYEVENI